MDLETTAGRLDLFRTVRRLDSFTEREKEMLASFATMRRVSAGASIYFVRAPAESFAVIASGIAVKDNMSRRRPLEPLSVIGTLPLLRRSQDLRFRTAGLSAETDVVLVEIPYATLERLTPERREVFLDSIAEEIMGVVQRLERLEP